LGKPKVLTVSSQPSRPSTTPDSSHPLLNLSPCEGFFATFQADLIAVVADIFTNPWDGLIWINMDSYGSILLMAEILHHLGCIKPSK